MARVGFDRMLTSGKPEVVGKRFGRVKGGYGCKRGFAAQMSVGRSEGQQSQNMSNLRRIRKDFTDNEDKSILSVTAVISDVINSG